MRRRREEKEGTNFISVKARREWFEDTDGAIGEGQVFSERNEECERRAEKKPMVSHSTTT